jgi:hypothetical protein
MDFSYTIFPLKKNKCWKKFKIMRKLLFNYSFYSHPEIGKFQGVTAARRLCAAALFQLKIASSGRGALAGTRWVHFNCNDEKAEKSTEVEGL